MRISLFISSLDFIVMMMVMMMMVTQHIPTMTKSHHGGEKSIMIKVGMCQCQKPTKHHYELFFGLYIYQVTHTTSGSFGMNFLIE